MAWIAGAALAAAQLYQQMNAQKRASGDAADATAQQDLAQRRGLGAKPPFQPTADQFRVGGGSAPGLADDLRAENTQNQQRLEQLKQGRSFGDVQRGMLPVGDSLEDVFRRAPAIGARDTPPLQPPQAEPTYMAGVRVNPGGAGQPWQRDYSMANVPTTETGGGLTTGQILGLASEAGAAIGQRGQPPPPAAINRPAAPNYSPTSIALLDRLQQLRQRGRL